MKREPMTDDAKQAWRDLLEGVLDGDYETPHHLTVVSRSGARTMLSPIHPEDEQP